MKKNILLAISIMALNASTAWAIGEQQRDFLYAMHELDKDFAQIPVISKNVDHFIDVMQVHSQLLSAKLQRVDKKVTTVLLQQCAVALAGVFSGAVAMSGLNILNRRIPLNFLKLSSVKILMNSCFFASQSFGLTVSIFAALNIHDGFKERNALRDALALDKEILAKLIDFKDSLDSSVNKEALDSELAD